MGIGVDSNVLIFERIKEELAAQRGVRAAINAGFDRVFLTLLDTHVASLIAAVFLFQFGTGPIRGFALDAVRSGWCRTCSRPSSCRKTLFEFGCSRSAGRPSLASENRSMQIFKNPNFDFVRWRWHAIALSWLVILAGVAVMLDQRAAARRRVLRRHDRHPPVRPAAARLDSGPDGARARPAGRGPERRRPALRRRRAAR